MLSLSLDHKKIRVDLILGHIGRNRKTFKSDSNTIHVDEAWCHLFRESRRYSVTIKNNYFTVSISNVSNGFPIIHSFMVHTTVDDESERFTSNLGVLSHVQ